jgi:hypothetical protein
MTPTVPSTGWTEYSGVQTGGMGLGSENWYRSIDQQTITATFSTESNWAMCFVVLKGS